jgi:hypothetical protein
VWYSYTKDLVAHFSTAAPLLPRPPCIASISDLLLQFCQTASSVQDMFLGCLVGPNFHPVLGLCTPTLQIQTTAATVTLAVHPSDESLQLTALLSLLWPLPPGTAVHRHRQLAAARGAGAQPMGVCYLEGMN